MLPYAIVPQWHIGPLHMNMYGVMFALGVLAASLLAEREATRRGLSREAVETLVLYLLAGTIIGARLFYVLFYWPADMPFSFYEAIAVWHGGLAFLGGLLGAATAGFLYLRKRGLPFLPYADLFTAPLLVGHILGRIGDYLTGGHPGKLTTLPWGIYLNGAVRHPVVLYEILGLIIILGIILMLRKRKLQEGVLFASYLALYALQRFILDFFRIESTDPRTFGLTPTQIGLLIFGLLALWFIVHRSRGKQGIEAAQPQSMEKIRTKKHAKSN